MAGLATCGYCDYHTSRAEDLEATVRAQLARVTVPASPAPGTIAAGAADGAAGAHREGLRRRIDALLERRARGEWTADRLRQEAGALALADLEPEEQAEVVARRRADVLGAADHEQGQAAARARLVRLWDALPFAERRRLLREVGAAVVVTERGGARHARALIALAARHAPNRYAVARVREDRGGRCYERAVHRVACRAA